MDASQILPNLYVGSCPRDAVDADDLKRETGVTAVLNLQTIEDFAAWHIDWEALEAYYGTLGIEVRQVPVRDFDADSLKNHLPDAVRALDDLLRAGHTVYLHCNVGVNRSPSVAIAYLTWVEGRDLADAYEHVRNCRPCDPYTEVIRQAEAGWRGSR